MDLDNQGYPNVLVVSHNSFSDTLNNGKTLSSLFKNWPKENLAQLYFWPELPDVTTCYNFFRITDYEVLDSFITRKNLVGTIINGDPENLNGSIESSIVKNLTRNRGNHNGGKGFHKIISGMFKKRLSGAILIRDYMWNKKFPETTNFSKWIESFKPDVVFLQCSNGVFPYRIALQIGRKYNIPILLQITDDYLTPRGIMTLSGWLHHKKLIKEVKKVINYSSCVFAIGEKMAVEYENRFGGKYEIFMNTVDTSNSVISSNETKRNDNCIKFLYAGSLHTNRWKTLSVIGEALKELRDDGLNCKFDVYTNIKPEDKVLKAISYKGIMEYCGSLTPIELENKMNEYDILVHVEAFDKNSKHITRLSVSTKIPEYLAKGKSLLAVGPADIASIEYLVENNVANVIDNLDKNHIKSKLKEIIENKELRNQKIINGIELARKRHDSLFNREKIKKIFF
jgi:glycosyltransferase involved in cell wall biosynthesis